METQSVTQYDKVAKLLHWSVVVLLIVQFISAWTMPSLRRAPSPTGLVSFHLSFGVVILVIMLLRLCWRLMHRPPALPSSLSSFEVTASHAMHYLLYLLLVLLPLSGWAWASSRGWSVDLFGVVPLPNLFASGSTFAKSFGSFHSGIATILLFLIGGHVVAALYHHFGKHDGVMQRMLPAK